VPGSGLPFLLSMSNPMPNEAMPELLPEHGRNTLNTEQKGKYASVLNYYTNYCTYIKFIKFTH